MTEMTESRLNDFFTACNERDLDRLADFFTDDASYLASIGPDDDGTRFMGRAEVRRGLGAFLDGHSELAYTDVEVWVAGGRGIATWTFAGTTLAGSRYTYRGVDVFTFAGDLVRCKDAFRKERAGALGA
jgi:ketosteroid isomerase-like protein